MAWRGRRRARGRCAGLAPFLYLRRLPGRAASSSSDAIEALLLRRELVVDVADAILSRRRCCRHVEKSTEPREDTELLACIGDAPRSPPSSLESAALMEDPSPLLWTRAWRRMLLKTLKLRPHPSTGHTKATAVSVSCVAGRKSGQTFFSGVAIEMDLRWGEPEDRIREGGSHLQAARAVEAFPTIRALVLGTAGVGWGV